MSGRIPRRTARWIDALVTYRTRRRRYLTADIEFDSYMQSVLSDWEPPRRVTGRPFDFRKHARSGPR